MLWNLGHSFAKIYIVELQIHISIKLSSTFDKIEKKGM